MFILTSLKIQMSQSEDDLDQQIVDWTLENEGCFSDDGAVGDDGKEKDAAATVADGEKGKEVIDVDGEEGKKRKEMLARSKIWEHFIKIKENDVLVRGKCKYCNAEIKAHPVLNGTSGMRKHFSICRSNPHRSSDDATQGVLQVTEGNSVGT
jgi:hypothetical protein